MKPKIILITLSTLFLLLFVVGCDDKKEEPHPASINGTWKCIGFGDAKGKLVKEIEPKDCKECYTLTFKEDGKLHGQALSNGFTGNYSIQNKTQILQISNIISTHLNEFYDGAKYFDCISNATNYQFVKNNQLILLYNNKSESLIFKSIEL